MFYPRKLNDSHIEILLDNKEARLLAEWINFCAQHSQLTQEDVRKYRNIASDIVYNIDGTIE